MGNLVKLPIRAGCKQSMDTIMRIIGTEKPTLSLAVSLILTLTVSCGMFDSGPPIGHRLPEVRFEDLKNQYRSTCEIDTPSILFFYNPSCQPCRNVLTILHSYFEQTKGPLPNLFLLVKQGQKSSLDTELSRGFPVLTISHKTWYSVFQINRTPLLLFYQAQRQLLRKQVGWRPAALQRRILDDFVRETRKTAMQASRDDKYSLSEHLQHKRPVELNPLRERR